MSKVALSRGKTVPCFRCEMKDRLPNSLELSSFSRFSVDDLVYVDELSAMYGEQRQLYRVSNNFR